MHRAILDQSLNKRIRRVFLTHHIFIKKILQKLEYIRFCLKVVDNFKSEQILMLRFIKILIILQQIYHI